MNTYDISFAFGAYSSECPEIWMYVGNNYSVNLLEFLKNQDVYSVIVFMRDLFGVALVLGTIICVFKNLNNIINGRWSANNTDWGSDW